MEPSHCIDRAVVKASVLLLMLALARGVGTAQTPVWYVQHDFSPNVIKDMDSRDSLRCLVAMDSTLFVISRILKTTDGGVSWRTVLRRHNPNGFIGRVVSVAWPTDLLAVATADSGRLLRSTDGGETWDDRRMFDSNSTPYVRMVDSLHGFVYLDYVPEPRTFTTDDGGLTWEPFAVPDPVGYDVRWWVWSRTPAPVRISPSRFICVREGRGNFTESRLLVTSDRGSAWDTARTAFPGWEAYGPWAFGMRFADSLFGWASIRRNAQWVISRTTDGGFTWSIVFSDSVTNVNTSPWIMWAGDSLRVMIGSHVLALRSTDGGVTWSRDSSRVGTNEHPNSAPLHPRGSWPVFAFNLFQWNKLLHYGIPPATTEVERPDHHRARPDSDGKVRIVELHVESSCVRLRIASGTTSAVSVRLFDLTGRLLYRADRDDGVTAEQTIEIPVERLPAGLYAVWIVTVDGADGRLVPILKR